MNKRRHVVVYCYTHEEIDRLDEIVDDDDPNGCHYISGIDNLGLRIAAKAMVAYVVSVPDKKSEFMLRMTFDTD